MLETMEILLLRSLGNCAVQREETVYFLSSYFPVATSLALSCQRVSSPLWDTAWHFSRAENEAACGAGAAGDPEATGGTKLSGKFTDKA